MLLEFSLHMPGFLVTLYNTACNFMHSIPQTATCLVNLYYSELSDRKHEFQYVHLISSYMLCVRTLIRGKRMSNISLNDQTQHHLRVVALIRRLILTAIPI